MDKRINGWPILLTLYYANKIPLHIKLQKMLFLIFSEAKVKIPYNFTKFDHGPYDPEIKIDFLNLGNENYIDVRRYVRGEKTYWIFSITQKGKEYVEKTLLKSFTNKDLKQVEKIVLKYNKMDWRELVSLVYKKYNIEISELNKKRAIVKDELNRIRPLWEHHYEKNKCEHIFISLVFIDYSIIMLNEKRFDDLDITQYNVLMNFMEDSLKYLKKETVSFSNCDENEKCERLPEIKELFRFVQYIGEKFKILPATYNDEAFLEDFDVGEKEPNSDKLWKPKKVVA